MSDSREQEQALTLAVIMQAVQCIREVARTGDTEASRYEPLIEGLLGEYDGCTDALYGAARLAPGLRRVVEQLEDPQEADTTRYVASIFHLERRLMKRQAVLQRLAEGIEQARGQAAYFESPTHTSVIHGIGDLYSQTISQMGPRLMIRGEQQHLENERNAALIRALLLCGIRGASLWRDNGGGRMTLLFRRQAIAGAARNLLEGLPSEA
ncbi:MAG: high frequency lysogenization protein HflD [Halorhodospira halophila]|uniref:high frequency lysogenization protein HflD n=1 Tax=Halorhodospira TaxID=85108 RepID=UPI001911D9F7|nr:high frequency lysogenization protein HflD [Halorhodospira halophila]MCG5532147.1 high frequency lysogenization protein HflD [Halorhodospira sp. 9621]MCG5537113.1 high frequency lysogenization protein HflD [Halorhodospira sp. 9622]MCG5542539.1 high frequency lysogenization protein HflD [Halorhodospira sp. 9628]MBK5936063.1 lysogenization regulator HflD [Halorhodospira halophila]MBK5943724.1 lysogenization regulator HflD [Halorhodospira halophila]